MFYQYLNYTIYVISAKKYNKKLCVLGTLSLAYLLYVDVYELIGQI